MAFAVTGELHVGVKDRPGELAAVLKVVAGAGVDVRAFCAYSMEGSGTVMFVPSDAKKAKAALKKAGYAKVGSTKVVVGAVKDTRGAGAKLTGRAAKAGVNLDYAYATGTGKGMGLVVLAAGKGTAKLLKALT
mgnify:CR=1 FL=1